jgi:glutaredoxin
MNGAARRAEPAALRRRPARPLAAALAATAAAGLLAAGPALAQYKVVAPDGSVTYTDRPLVVPGARVQTIGPSGTVLASPTQPLPAELRPVVARFPVTLYTGGDCQPCDAARQMLRQRGIPFAERTVNTEDDAAALQRLSNARTLPTLAVGQQVQRGWQDGEWANVLDLAGYPAQSRLPRDYQAPAALPLATPVRAAEPATAPLPSASVAPAARPAIDPASGQPNIRF